MLRAALLFLLALPQVAGAKSLLSKLESEMTGIVKKVSPSVVIVEAKEGEEGVKCAFSGFVFDKKGHIVTQYRPVADAEEIGVVLSTGKRCKAELIGGDDLTNIAVLKVVGQKMSPVSIGSSRRVIPGSWAIVLSSSFGLSPAISLGIMSGKRDDGMLQISTPVSPGGSGGVVVGPDGRVIGMVKAGITGRKRLRIISEAKDMFINKEFDETSGPSDMMLALPVDQTVRIVNRLIKDGEIERGYLGVFLKDGEEGKGVIVAGVQEDTPAEEAGIEKGDIIAEIDGKPMATHRSVIEHVGAKKPGNAVKVKLLRNGEEKVVKATLTKRDKMAPEKKIFKFKFPPMKDMEEFGEEFGEEFEGLGKELGSFLKGLPEHWEESTSKAFLGIYPEDIGPELAEYFGAVEGILVTKTIEDGPAKKAGLKAGDVITEIDGEKIENCSDLREVLRDKNPGDKIKVKVLRQKKVKTFDVKLNKREPSRKMERIKKIKKIVPKVGAVTGSETQNI
jgi:S1-C subfamily serine protease